MKKAFLRAVALTAALSMVTMNMAFAGGSIGHGNISVYKDNVLVTKLSGQNPIEDGALLVCEGRCILKSEGISLIGADKSNIGIANETDTFKLFVKEGLVDYVINSNSRKIAFYTPQGTYTVAEVVFSQSSASLAKGNVKVNDDGNTEISVIDGRMVFATSDGMKTVDANHKIVLAVAPGESVQDVETLDEVRQDDRTPDAVRQGEPTVVEGSQGDNWQTANKAVVATVATIAVAGTLLYNNRSDLKIKKVLNGTPSERGAF